MAISITGAAELGRDITSAARRFPTEQENAMQASLLLIERDARANVKQDTRALMNSISSRIKTQGGGHTLIGTVGPSKGYGFWVHEGRKPGKQPPIKAVEGWARRHGISPFLVARAIGRKGTKPNPFMDIALTKNARRITDLFEKAGAKIVAAVRGR